MGKVILTRGHGKCKYQEVVSLRQGMSVEETGYGWTHSARWRDQKGQMVCQAKLKVLDFILRTMGGTAFI